MRRHPLRRVIVAAGRIPALADRRGMRWLLNGRVMPGGPIVLLTYRGRLTGKIFTTPVEALVEDREKGEVVITPLRGERSDWYRNTLAGGLIQIRLRGQTFRPQSRKLAEKESREALARYVDEHPLFGRIVIRGMGRGLRGSDDRLTAIANTVPLLALRKEPLPGGASAATKHAV